MESESQTRYEDPEKKGKTFTWEFFFLTHFRYSRLRIQVRHSAGGELPIIGPSEFLESKKPLFIKWSR